MRYFVHSKLSENIHQTPEGYLLCLGVSVARIGTQLYGEGETPLETKDGIVEIMRDEKEVFNSKTLASFEGKPVTIGHPAEFVTPKTWQRLTNGIMQNVRRGEGDQKDDIVADLLITGEIGIGLVKNGLREVSCGYEADYVQTEDGKGKQLCIRGNHLALVEKGRAGSAYAIRDHETIKGVTMKLSERIKAVFAKAQDEALKIADEEHGVEGGEKKEEKKADDASGMDELLKMVKDLGAKVDAMSKPKDEEKKDDAKADDAEGEEGEKKDDKKADDAEGEEAGGVEDRLKALETAVAKILAILEDGESEESADEDGEESEDEDTEETDDEESEGSVVGDDASRIEILAPGSRFKGKDARKKALEAAYATDDGKRVIDALAGGKKVTFDAKTVDTMFVATSEVLKSTRNELAGTKKAKATDNAEQTQKGPMTPERMNEMNAKRYNLNK